VKPTRELLRRIQKDKIDQASNARPIDRLLVGLRLHDVARERMRLGLNLTHPDATPEDSERIIRERFARQRERDSQLWNP
jgi:hypothetical protein